MDKFPPIIGRFPCFLYGGDYNPEQWMVGKEVWKDDMRLAKLAHCNTLSIGIFSWAALESEEGFYRFDWMDEVMDLLVENGMVAVLATPSGARPAWLSRKYPEVLRVNENRQRILHGGRHNHCYTSPVYREKVRLINTKLAERYNHHPALGVWHLSNEYGGECHCELCQEAFRSWLKTRYPSLEALNHAWWTAFWSHTYTEWPQVESPSESYGETSIHGLTLDWKRFVTEQTIDFMKAEMEPLRRLSPGVPCTTNMMGFYDGLNYFRLAEELDVASWDSYPQWTGNESDAALASRTSLLHDLNRGLKDGKPFMLMESSPSATNWQDVGKLRRPGGNMLYSLQAVAHGSDTVQYFQFRKSRGSAEKFHAAIVDHEGSDNTRVFREVAETGGLLEKLSDVIGAGKPSEVALLYDVENRWALEGCYGFRREKKYVETVEAHYAPFWSMGISVDIVDSTKDFSRYKLLVAPMLYMLRPGMTDKIDQFVKAGGTFVATYMTGYVDEHDLCFLGGFPGPIKDILGIWCEEIDSLYDGEHRLVSWNGKGYLASDFCEIVHLQGAEKTGRYEEDFYMGSPAITVNQFGKGKAYYVAARMGEDFHQDFFGKLVDELGIRMPFQNKLPPGCTVQVRSDGDNDFQFIMNFLSQPAIVNVGDGGTSMINDCDISGEQVLKERSIQIIRRKSET